MRLTLDLHSTPRPPGRTDDGGDCRRPGQRAARVAVCDHDVVYTGPTEVDAFC